MFNLSTSDMLKAGGIVSLNKTSGNIPTVRQLLTAPLATPKISHLMDYRQAMSNALVTGAAQSAMTTQGGAAAAQNHTATPAAIPLRV
jgi:hypothetical protein